MACPEGDQLLLSDFNTVLERIEEKWLIFFKLHGMELEINV